MSLGCRVYSRSRSLACSNPLATPRDALTFLYPAFHFRTPRARYETTSTQAQAKEKPEDGNIHLNKSYTCPAGIRPVPHKLEITGQLSSGDVHDQPKLSIKLAKYEQVQQERDDSPANDNAYTESTLQKDILRETTVPYKNSKPALESVPTTKFKSLKEAPQGVTNHSKLPVRLVPINSKRQPRYSVSSELTAKNEVHQGPTAESIQETLKLTPITVRGLRCKVKMREELRDGAVVEEKSSWSYDWRQPLDALKTHCRDEASDASLIPLGRPYLLSKRPRYHEVRAQDIPLPAAWSTSSFADYVQDLTQSKVSRVYNRYIYKGDMRHTDAVHDALMHVFEDLSLRPYWTPKAFDIAFMYCYKHLRIPSVRRLFNLMFELHMDIPTETFNVILKGAAARKDLHHLTFILRYMARKGVSPNADSWIALLRAVQSYRAKLIIYKEMEETGVLSYPATLQNAVAAILDVQLAIHVTGGQKLAPFIQQLDTRYGRDWLSLSAVNQVCHRLGENGLVSQAMEVLKVATDRNIKPNIITFRTFLSHSLRLRRPKLALQIVELFHSKYRIYPDEAAYDLLFMVAFRSQRLQLCKVIWRYACLHNAVSFRMEQIVTRSLLRNTPQEPQTNLQRWMKTAGKAIVGIDLGVEKKEPKPVPRPPGWEIIEILSKWAPAGDKRERATQLAKTIVERDLNAWRRYLPRFTLVPMLKSALYRDTQWEEQGKRDAPLLWKVENSIRVQIRVPSVKEIKKQNRISKWKERRFGN